MCSRVKEIDRDCFVSAIVFIKKSRWFVSVMGRCGSGDWFDLCERRSTSWGPVRTPWYSKWLENQMKLFISLCMVGASHVRRTRATFAKRFEELPRGNSLDTTSSIVHGGRCWRVTFTTFAQTVEEDAAHDKE